MATSRVTITIDSEKLKILEKEAKRQGLKIPVYCRIVLNEKASTLEEK